VLEHNPKKDKYFCKGATLSFLVLYIIENVTEVINLLEAAATFPR